MVDHTSDRYPLELKAARCEQSMHPPQMLFRLLILSQLIGGRGTYAKCKGKNDLVK